MGMESKLVVTGDGSQSDLPTRQRGAFENCLEKLTNVPDLGVIHLQKEDIVRNPLIPIILERLSNDKGDFDG